MDRQIVMAAFAALVLATLVKIVTPIETVADVQPVKMRQVAKNLPLTFTPDPMWLVGP